jgi:hypothetical protein
MQQHQLFFFLLSVPCADLCASALPASMMCVSRATERAANESVERIHIYHDTHPADDSDEAVNADRGRFL